MCSVFVFYFRLGFHVTLAATQATLRLVGAAREKSRANGSRAKQTATGGE
jgi:hypothetical protein